MGYWNGHWSRYWRSIRRELRHLALGMCPRPRTTQRSLIHPFQAFYINLVIGAVFAPVYFLLLPSINPLPNASQKEKAQNIDWVGSILFIGSLASLIMGIDFGGVEWKWGSGSSIALFVVSGVLFILFGVQQTFYIFCNEQNRLFPIHFIKRRSLVLLFILNSESSPPQECLLGFLPLMTLFFVISMCQQWTVHLGLLYPTIFPVLSGQNPFLKSMPERWILISNRVILHSTLHCAFCLS